MIDVGLLALVLFGVTDGTVIDPVFADGFEFVCEQVPDPLDADFTDTNCDGTDGVVSACVFVSPTLGAPAGTGTRAAPLNTIAGGIARAVLDGKRAVCLSGESYFENVNLPAGIALHGGFDQAGNAFVRSASTTTTITGIGTAVLVSNVNAPTEIAGLTLESQVTIAQAAGSSAYGVRVVGGPQTVTVRLAVIDVGPGRVGPTGENGLAHANPNATGGINGQNGSSASSSGGTGGAAPSCAEPGGKGGNGGFDSNGNGMGGSNGNGGALGGPGGTASGQCFVQSANGQPGINGASGTQGTPGAGGSSSTIAGGLYAPVVADNGTLGTSGKGGGGGGGGGGGASTLGCNPDRGGGGGSGGCGGLRGNAGSGGGGGGGSFGVFAVTGASVVVQQSIIIVGAGGVGGTGGDGAAGQGGGTRGSASAGADDAGGGGQGGLGGNGGAGGPGGGGLGGPSVCVARSTTSSAAMTSTTCTFSAGGNGGPGGTNPAGGVGASGQPGISSATATLNGD